MTAEPAICMKKVEKNTVNQFKINSKVKNIDLDTVELIHSYFQYDRFVSTMSDSDYFVSNDRLRLLKSDLTQCLDSGIINAVERDYKKSSRFTIEK